VIIFLKSGFNRCRQEYFDKKYHKKHRSVCSFLAHMAEGQLSLWDGAASVVRSQSSVKFFFKRFLLRNRLVDL